MVVTDKYNYEQALKGEIKSAAHTKSHTKKAMNALRGTEALICQPLRYSHVLCCLLGVKIWGVTERVPQLVRNMDYYPLLLCHVGKNDTASQNLGRIEQDCKALVVQVKEIGAQVNISCVLIVRGKGAASGKCIM